MRKRREGQRGEGKATGKRVKSRIKKTDVKTIGRKWIRENNKA